eukprot:7532678-Heterocapsa_arctica.AAC.1
MRALVHYCTPSLGTRTVLTLQWQKGSARILMELHLGWGMWDSSLFTKLAGIPVMVNPFPVG